MTRKDAVLVGVLLNAGLLVVLFAMSMKDDDSAVEKQMAADSAVAVQMQPVTEIAAISPTSPMTPADEIEQKIKQFAPPVLAQEAVPVSSFASDLQAIGTPTENSSSATLPGEMMAPKVDAPVEKEVALKEVKVKKGDVLERIARQNHVTVDAIMKANNLKTPRLKIGQILKIPPSKASVASHKEGSTPGKEEFYIVKNGDNPWVIAVKHHMKVEDLLKLNQMDEEKARKLRPGDRIRVVAKGS